MNDRYDLKYSYCIYYAIIGTVNNEVGSQTSNEETI